jgi:hypothetical protein
MQNCRRPDESGRIEAVSLLKNGFICAPAPVATGGGRLWRRWTTLKR